jgi:pimeloyl-ACP methyl ester carboxylesterase
MRDVFDAAYGAARPEALFARAESVRAQPWAKYLDVVAHDDDLEGWRLSRYDPAPVLSRTRLPLLALFGENDVLVPPAENVEPMRRLLAQAGNADVTIRVIPGAAHDMETFGTLRGGGWNWPEHYWVWARRAPSFEATITAWLRERGIGS